MAALDGLRFARYRSFRDLQEVKLRPITLLFGPNSSGKSAVARLAPWLDDCLGSLDSLFLVGPNFDTPALLGAGWDQVRWRGGLPSNEENFLALGASLSDGTAVDWTLDWHETFAEPIVRRLVARAPSGEECALEWAAQPDERSGRRSYRCGQSILAVTLNGLLPAEGAPDLVRAAGYALAVALRGTRWLGALREGPSRTGLPRRRGGQLDHRGQGREALVLADGEIRERVSTWYRDAAGIDVIREQAGENERLSVRPAKAAGWSVSFSDVGTGLQRAFPVVVDLEMIRTRGGVLVVEEPEAHLHPGLERRLAQLFVAVARAQPDARLIVETHSEVFLLEVLLALTEEEELASLYWTEAREDGSSVVEHISVSGGVVQSDRLVRAFDTMGGQRRQLLEARKLRAR